MLLSLKVIFMLLSSILLHSHLHHHRSVGYIGPPLLRSGPAHQRIRLIIVNREASETGETLLDLAHCLDLLLEDGQGIASSLRSTNRKLASKSLFRLY